MGKEEIKQFAIAVIIWLAVCLLCAFIEIHQYGDWRGGANNILRAMLLYFFVNMFVKTERTNR